MGFLNLGLAEFLTLAGVVSLATVAVYLLQRSRRRLVVSTLRFWTEAQQPVHTERRRRLQQPWSLLLQILGALFLLLAVAQPRWASVAKPAHHVLILETSAWMSARRGSESLMDIARQRVERWLQSVPEGDAVMMVRADAVPTPATVFETDHARVLEAIAASAPGASTLNIAEAIRFARHAQALQGLDGEVVFVGTGRIKSAQAEDKIGGNELRVILVPDALETAGLRSLSASRSAADASQWDVLATVHNYGGHARAVAADATFAGAPIGSSRLELASGAEREVHFTVHAREAGLLEVQLSPPDAFAEDDRASLTLPALAQTNVVVYADRPESVRPFLDAAKQVHAEFRPWREYRADGRDSIAVNPPIEKSPIRVVKQVRGTRVIHWTAKNPLAAGLHAQDITIDSASVFQPTPGDLVVAQIAEGPVMVARPGEGKLVVLGFDPRAIRYRLAMPLLFGNVLHWLDPQSVRGIESVSAQTLPDMWDTKWSVPTGVQRGIPPQRAPFPKTPELWRWLATLGAACLISDWLLLSRHRRAPMRAMPSRTPLRRAS